MQITDNRSPVASYNCSAGSSSSIVANGAVVEVEGVEGQFIKIPNKGVLRLSNGDRRFINLGTGGVYQCPASTPVRVVSASLTLS